MLYEVITYTVANVSLPRQRSAMIPIVSDAVTVAPLSIYNETVLQSHPLNRITSYNVCYTKLLRLQGDAAALRLGEGDIGRIEQQHPGGPQEAVITSYSIHYTKLYD